MCVTLQSSRQPIANAEEERRTWWHVRGASSVNGRENDFMSDDEEVRDDRPMLSSQPLGEATPTETPAARARRRAMTINTWFVVFLILGVLGSAALGYFGSERTTLSSGFLNTVDSTTTHDATIGWFFFSGLVATLFTTLPLLGISFLLEGQADILSGQPTSETK